MMDSFAVRTKVSTEPGQLQRGDSGTYVVEFIASALCTRDGPRQHARNGAVVVPERRRYGPGSAWTYARLYLGSQAIDDYLRCAVAPFVRSLRERGCIDRWFFVRYADPQSHVRIRFRAIEGHEHVVRERFLALAEDWLATDRILQYALDTYDPEYERFGAAGNVEEVERFFEADSDACIEIIATVPPTTAALVSAAAESFDVFIRSLLPDDAAHRVLGGFARRRLNAEDRLALKRLLARGQRSENSEPAPAPTAESRFEEHFRDLLHLHCNRLGLYGEAEARVATLLRALLLSRYAQIAQRK